MGTRTAALLLVGCAYGIAARADPPAPFSVKAIPNAGRAVAAEIGDLDGDGRADLLVIAVSGVPPDETRTIRVRYQAADGSFPDAPDFETPLPRLAAVYDVADVDERAGTELVLLERERLSVLSLAGRTPSWRELPSPTTPTAAVLPDERGIERLRLLRPELGGKRFLVPARGEAVVLGADGELLGRLRVGGRANYFAAPRPGPLASESEIDIYFDVPHLDVADVDGDGRADVVASTRHGLRVFLQRADGHFPSDPDRELPLRLISADDHVRNSGLVRVAVADIDGDGRADLLITSSSGGLLRATTQTRIHRNRNGVWDLAHPDQIYENRGGAVIDQLIDLDGDGRAELLRVVTPLGLIDLAQFFLQRAVEADASIYRAGPDGRFAAKPSYEHSFSFGMNFETMRLRGFVPTLEVDANGDGQRDLVASGDGSALEVYLGGPDYRFAEHQGRQELDTGGRISFGDLDGDGLPDFVIYDPRRADVPVRVGRNLGLLPGTPPAIRAR
jgi:hypothetical protein